MQNNVHKHTMSLLVSIEKHEQQQWQMYNKIGEIGDVCNEPIIIELSEYLLCQDLD